MTITTNIIISCSSLDGANFKEAIDIALVCAAFDQQVNIIFIEAGINNLITGQSANLLNDKNHVDIIKGLEFYDIENIYLEGESLDQTGITIDQILPTVKLKSISEIRELNYLADHLVVF